MIAVTKGIHLAVEGDIQRLSEDTSGLHMPSRFGERTSLGRPCRDFVRPGQLSEDAGPRFRRRRQNGASGMHGVKVP